MSNFTLVSWISGIEKIFLYSVYSYMVYHCMYMESAYPITPSHSNR